MDWDRCTDPSSSLPSLASVRSCPSGPIPALGDSVFEPVVQFLTAKRLSRGRLEAILPGMIRTFSLRFRTNSRWQHLAQAISLQVLDATSAAQPLDGASWLLLQCLHGQAACRWTGQEQTLQVDQALLLERCDLPSVELSSDSRLLLFAFTGAEAEATELADGLPTPLPLPARASIISRLLGFARLAADTPEHPLSLADASVLVHSLLAAIAHHGDQEQQHGPHLVRQACGLMQQAVEQAYDASELAEQLGVSATYFCRVFTEAMQVSPGQYHKQLRLAHAARLLKGSRLSIQQIAERIGYATQSAFARAFRSVYQLSPQEYREHGSIALA